MTSLPAFHPTVVHMLADAAEHSGDAAALVSDEGALTYRQYVRCVGGFAAELMEIGNPGDRVALICGNSMDMAIAMFAVHAARMQVVPVNPIYTERELHHILSDAEPVAVVFDDEVGPLIEGLADRLRIAARIRIGGEGGRSLAERRDDETAALPGAPPKPDELATLQYTGGTTGLPKGVNITHGQLSINLSQREAVVPTVPDGETVLCVMPLFHVFASCMCLHLTAHCRGRMVIQRRYHPDRVLDAIEREGITVLPVGPTIFNGLMAMDRFAATDFSTLRTVYSGSAPLPVDTLRKWRQVTGTPILEGYGQTEAGPLLTSNVAGKPIVPGSVGPPVPETEVQIVDVETGETVLPPGEEGEIRARGPQIMSGYRNRPEETALALRGGWLYTGDIGKLDEDGVLWITDRKKDMVIVGGYNVYPREIDEVLFAHPNVVEAAAVGVPDDYRGEAIHAFVVLRDRTGDPAAALLDYCRDGLAKYKVPAHIHVVDRLMKTTVGKIDKAAMRQSLTA